MTRARWTPLGLLLCALGAAAATAPTASGAAYAQDVPQVPEPAQEPQPESPEQAVRKALEHARTVASTGGGTEYAELWDAATMVKDVLASGDLSSLSQPKKVLLGVGLRFGIRAGFANDASVMAYERMDIREVQVTGDRAVAVIRGWNADDLGLSWRLWLIEKPGGWRICDAEEMSQGIRISRLLLAAVADGLDGSGTPEWVRRIPQLTAAAKASSEADWENVERLLARIDDVTFPPDFEAMRAMLRGIVALQVYGDPEATLTHVAEMNRVFPASVAGELIRGRALLELGRPSEVIPAVDRYLAVTGPSATALQLRGEALQALGRHKEALNALRRASVDSPPDANVLAVWMEIAEGRELGEPLRAFKMLRNPEVVFEPIVLLLRGAGDREAVDGLLAAFAQVRPENLDLAYWHAFALWDGGDPAAGITVLRPAIDRFRDEGALDAPETWPWLNLWCDLHEAAGTLGAAHAAVLGGRDVMIELGLRMAAGKQSAALAALVAAHARIAPDDPWLRLFRAEIQLADGAPENVEDLLASLSDGAGSEELRTLVRGCRARAFVARGQGLEGYAELGAPAFSELALRLYENGDGEVLMKLVTAHAEAQPGDALNVVVRLHALFLTGAHEEALAHFGANEDALVAWQNYAVYDSAFRAALRSGDTASAVRIAELARDEIDDPFPLAVVRLSAGDREAAEQEVRACLDRGFLAREFLTDPDAAKALEKESLRELRATLEELAAN